MKKIVIGFFLLKIIFGIGAWYWWQTHTQSGDTSNTDLSMRSSEFISLQRKSGTSLWNEVSFETASPAVLGSQSYSLSCFSIELPWSLVEERREDTGDTCILTGRVPTKRLHIAIRSEIFSDPLAEYPGVALRLKQTQKYDSEYVSIPNARESLFFQDTESSVLFVRFENRLLSLAFSGGMEKDRSVGELEKMMNSITY